MKNLMSAQNKNVIGVVVRCFARECTAGRRKDRFRVNAVARTRRHRRSSLTKRTRRYGTACVTSTEPIRS